VAQAFPKLEGFVALILKQPMEALQLIGTAFAAADMQAFGTVHNFLGTILLGMHRT